MPLSNRSLPRRPVLLLTLAAPLIAGAGMPARAADPAPGARAPQQASSSQDRVARGRYLVTTAGCHDCHTPLKAGPNGPEPDMSRALSGHPQDVKLPAPPQGRAGWATAVSATSTAWAGPWGTSYTANLTPDPETGLGRWTERNFVETIRTGRHWGRGRQILPPMPWPMYRNFTDADLSAIFAYLRSLPPIRNAVPEPAPPAGPATARR